MQMQVQLREGGYMSQMWQACGYDIVQGSATMHVLRHACMHELVELHEGLSPHVLDSGAQM